MTDANTPRERAVARLSAKDSPLRQELSGLLFDHVLDRPLSDVLAEDDLVALIPELVDERLLRTLAENLVVPASARIRASLAEADMQLGDTLPPASLEVLQALMRDGRGPRFRWAMGAVDAGLVRQLVSPALQKVLIQFTSKVPMPGGPGGAEAGADGASRSRRAGGIAGRLGRQMQKSAEQIAGVGRSVMGGLGAELEKRFQEIARDFSDTAVSELRRSVLETLRSEEGKKLLEQIAEGAVAHILAADLGEVLEDFSRVPAERIVDLLVPAVAHNLAGEVLPGVLRSEVACVLEEHGGRSVRSLLEQADGLARVRALVLRAADPGMLALVRSEDFAAWFDRLVAEQ